MVSAALCILRRVRSSAKPELKRKKSCSRPLRNSETTNACVCVSDRVAAVIAQGKHPVTFRTRKLSSAAPMVLHSGGCGRVGRRRTIFTPKGRPARGGPFVVSGYFRGQASRHPV